MPYDASLILALNAAGPGLSISPERAAEIALELAQFHAAAEAARKRAGFDIDPYDHRQALAALAGEAGR